MIYLFGEEGGKELSPIDFDLTIHMEDDPRQSDGIRRPQQVHKMWPRIATSVVHLFEERRIIAISCLEKGRSSVHRNVVVSSLYVVIMKFNHPRVPLE